ncbi:MAG: hypothetical protein LM522_13555 [Candidatus Contendobacter sp.]|nr:hypothetical protein [Candidatus Contendobacter sp.]
MQAWVIDTNVLLVAGGRHEDISPACVMACVECLEKIMREGRVALDDAYRILEEYQHKTNPNRGKGVGQVFLKWLLRNRSRCLFVALQEHPERGFHSFPEDPELVQFDPADRKFVAVAAACPEPAEILQAADSKWLGWENALKRHGIAVKFLCEDDLRRFRERKGMT